MTDWKARAEAAEAERDTLRAEMAKRASLGRKPGTPTTADGRLVARACKALGVTRSALAVRLDIAPSGLSRGVLAEAHRVALREMIVAAKVAQGIYT